MRSVETVCAAETEACGAELASQLAPGDVVLVTGEMGAGKTTFVRGACRALGVTVAVTSPSFAIGNRYRGSNGVVSHLDLYRLATLEGEDPGLLADYLGPDRIAFIEWPQQAESRLDGVRARVTLEHRGGDRRTIEVALIGREAGR